MATYSGLISLVKVSDGAQGAPGPAADEYSVQANQEEVLKFKKEGSWSFSPSKLYLIPKKKDEVLIGKNGFNFELSFYSIAERNGEIEEETIVLDREIVTTEEEYVVATEYTEGRTYYSYDGEKYEPITNDDEKPTESNFAEGLYYEFVSQNFNIYSVDTVNNRYIVHFDQMQQVCLHQGKDNDKEFVNKLKELFNKVFFILIFKIKEDEQVKHYYTTKCQNGMSDDMATFSLEAEKIVQAVQNTLLTFTADGLTLKNGAFTIVDNEGDALLGTDGDNLYVKGTIYATDGEFSGKLSAPTGEIGGFEITESQLNSPYTYEKVQLVEEDFEENTYYVFKDDSYQLAETYTEGTEYFKQNVSLVLNGEVGSIYAKDITLGESAKIEKYIQLGTNTRIYNSEFDESGGNILVSENVKISDAGKIFVGNIELDGSSTEGSIQVIDDNENLKWKINGEGTAIFNDIYANNVHLSNTIMEIGTVQNVGSLMIFKDAFAPSSCNGSVLEFNEPTSFKADDWLYNGKYYQVKETSNEGKTITLTSNYADDLQLPLSKFGQANSDFVFSAFGAYDSDNTLNYNFASPYSITLAELLKTGENTPPNFKKRLVLGQLDGAIAGNENVKGIGLYADNVYLKGSLISEGPIHKDIEDEYYSGINTDSGAQMPIYVDSDQTIPYFPDSRIETGEDDNKKTEYITGEILFWAGARKNTKGEVDIENSPFRVDSLGNLYAGSGYFKGSIISEATISAALLRTARIEGYDVESNTQALLTICGHDTSKSISLQDQAHGEVFSISNDGLSSQNVNFIAVGTEGVSSIGIFKNTNTSNISFTNEFDSDSDLVRLAYRKKENNTNDKKTLINLEFKDDLKIRYETNENNKTPIAEIGQIESVFNSNMIFNKNIQYSTLLEYKKVKDGYDLYVNDIPQQEQKEESE